MLKFSTLGIALHGVCLFHGVCQYAGERTQWNHEPVTHPEICVQFFVRDRRRDRDNMFTTALDCLREAGVIVNDNIAQFNGTLAILPAVIDEMERVVIRVKA